MPRISSSQQAEASAETWAGCCGVRLGPRGDRDAFGVSRGSPLLDLDLRYARIDLEPGHEIWRLSGEVSLPDRVVAYDQRLSTTDGESFILEAGSARLLIDPPQRRVVVEAQTESAALQLVTTMAIPILLEREPALVLHACAATAPGRSGATIVCGRAGTGKSSLLAGLIDAGWSAVSEDVCAVDLRGPIPVVWPGPPWLRRAGPGPGASAPRYQTLDKTAWDIAPMQTVDATPIDEIIFLESAGGERAEREQLPAAEVVRRLTLSTIWLTDPDARTRSTFHRTARLSRTIRCARVRFPVAADWLRTAATALEASG